MKARTPKLLNKERFRHCVQLYAAHTPDVSIKNRTLVIATDVFLKDLPETFSILKIIHFSNYTWEVPTNLVMPNVGPSEGFFYLHLTPMVRIHVKVMVYGKPCKINVSP